MGHWEVGGGVRGVVFGVLFFCMIGLWGTVLRLGLEVVSG